VELPEKAELPKAAITRVEIWASQSARIKPPDST